MPNSPIWSAVLCRRGSNRGAAVAVAASLAFVLAACGGTVSSSSSSSSGTDDAGIRGVQSTPPASCPTKADLASGAAIGKACGDEGAYCTDFACDPCRSHCPAVSCTHGVWKTAVNTATCTGGDNGDASPPPPKCVTLDPSTYDQSCHVDSDCVLVSSGTFCSDTQRCACPNATINRDDQASYANAFANSPAASSLACPCAAPGIPRCVQNRCTLCNPGSPQPGCLDDAG